MCASISSLSIVSYPKPFWMVAQATASSDTSRGKSAESPNQVLIECLRILNHKQEKDEPLVFKRLQVSLSPPLCLEARHSTACIICTPDSIAMSAL